MNAGRRETILLAAGMVLLALGHAARAQPRRTVLIGWLYSGSRSADGVFLAEFKAGLAALRWTEGEHYVLVERWAEGRTEALPRMAGEIAARKPAVIVAAPATSVGFAMKAAPRTPIVQASGRSPVETARAESLARPGGMVTGLTTMSPDLSEKVAELLLVAMPRIRRVGFLVDGSAPKATRAERFETARLIAGRLSIEAVIAEAARVEDVHSALALLGKQAAEALVVLPSAWFLGRREEIVRSARTHRLPVAGVAEEWADSGALIGYGADRNGPFRRAAWYVDRILKGTKPGDLPIEQPTTFELVVNLRTAKALGIAIPQSILLQATRVIE